MGPVSAPRALLLSGLLLSPLLLTSCMGRRELREAARLEGRYELGAPGDGWREVAGGGADYAFRNTELAATIYSDSNCGVRFEDGPLPDLAKHMLAGVADLKGPPVYEELRALDGRDAYVARRSGKLDGVPIELGVAVLQKDSCVYDMVLIAPPGARFEQAWGSYLSLIDGFRTTS